jgi:DNA repair protein RecO (recombination protein O)
VDILKFMLGTNFDRVKEYRIIPSQRQALLELLMNYFKLHLQGFERPKSLGVLYEIFR